MNDSSFKIGAILIDAGHGGKDPGTVGSVTKNGKKIQLNEKDFVLSVAQDLHNALKSKYPDKKILMTRSTDVYLTLEQRVEIANSVEAKLSRLTKILGVVFFVVALFCTFLLAFMVSRWSSSSVGRAPAF